MFKKIIKNRIPWTVRQDLPEKTLDNLYARLKNAGSVPGFTIVKANPVRTVVSLPPDEEHRKGLFVKFYKSSTFIEKIKHLAVPSKARSEWRKLNRFRQLGLPCPAPLAFSEVKPFGLLKESCLLLEALPAAVPLNDHMENTSLSAEGRRKIILSLARLVRNLHQQQIFYRDLHAGNILITEKPGPNVSLFFIDLHRAALPGKISQWMQIKDLAQLLNSISLSDSEQAAFLEAYLGKTTGPGRFRERVAEKQARLESARIKSRSKRCLKNSSVFEKRKAAGERYYGRRLFGKEKTDVILNRHQSVRDETGDRILKKTRKSILTVIEKETPTPLCVKEDRFVSRTYTFKNLFRQSRALKSWIAANGLMVRGLDTPLPLAVVDRKTGFLIRRSFLITEFIKEAKEANRYITVFKDPSQKKNKSAFIKAFAQVFQKLHQQKIYHADLKSNNILVRQTDSQNWTFYFIDLDRVSFNRSLSFYQRANNLAQLNASISDLMTAKDRLKFFYFYAKDTSLYQNRKGCFRKILEISRTKNTEPYGIRFK